MESSSDKGWAACDHLICSPPRSLPEPLPDTWETPLGHGHWEVSHPRRWEQSVLSCPHSPGKASRSFWLWRAPGAEPGGTVQRAKGQQRSSPQLSPSPLPPGPGPAPSQPSWQAGALRPLLWQGLRRPSSSSREPSAPLSHSIAVPLESPGMAGAPPGPAGLPL